MNLRVFVVGLVIITPLAYILLFNINRDPHMINSPLIGRTAPPFALKPVGGGDPISLDGLKGKPVVLNFWGTFCIPCVEEHPALQQIAQARRDVQFLGVMFDDQESNIEEFLKKHGSVYPTLADPGGQTAIAYGIFGVPETFFIDPTGRIVDKQVGPMGPGDILAHLDRMSSANAVPR
jgi:cytochrome c biogenesis protein CcmG/thiol:disulfide interchange protein DsbE